MKTILRESDVLKAVMDYLGAQGFSMFRRNTGVMMAGKRFVRFSSPGMADLWGLDRRTGRHIEVEVKRLGQKPTPVQSAWLEAMRKAGAVAFWCDSVSACREALLVATVLGKV